MFKKLLLEALKPSQFRKYMKMKKNNPEFQKELNLIFSSGKFQTNRSKDRIYLDYKYDLKEDDIDKSGVKKLVNAVLYNIDYKIDDYIKGTCLKRESSDKRVFKIGRVLAKLKDTPIGFTYEIRDEKITTMAGVLKAFNEDPGRGAAKPKTYKICISKHPYDIAGMSTDRGWTSCMQLPTGSNTWRLEPAVRENCLVAYLITDDDLNIEHPLGRATVYTFIDKQNKNNRILQTSNVCYGSVLRDNKTNREFFIKTVQEWVDEVVNKDKEGIFVRANSLYPETDTGVIRKGKGKGIPLSELMIGINSVEIKWRDNGDYGTWQDIEDWARYYRHSFSETYWRDFYREINNIEIKDENDIGFELEILLKNWKGDEDGNTLSQKLRWLAEESYRDYAYEGIETSDYLDSIRGMVPADITSCYDELWISYFSKQKDYGEKETDIKHIRKEVLDYFSEFPEEFQDYFEDTYYELVDNQVNYYVRGVKFYFRFTFMKTIETDDKNGHTDYEDEELVFDDIEIDFAEQ